jgi:hypothetical protein
MIETTRPAALRAYAELTALGLPDRGAFESAVTLVRLRSPELPGPEVTHMVADWICEALGQ